MCSVLSHENRCCISSAEGGGGDVFRVWARNAISPISLTRKENSFYLSRSQNMTPYLCTYIKKELYICKETYISEQRPISTWAEVRNWRHISTHIRKETYISEKRPKYLKRNLFLPEQKWEYDAISPHIHEKRPVFLKRDLYPWKAMCQYAWLWSLEMI